MALAPVVVAGFANGAQGATHSQGRAKPSHHHVKVVPHGHDFVAQPHGRATDRTARTARAEDADPANPADPAPLSMLGQHYVTVVPIYWGDAVPPADPPSRSGAADAATMQAAFDKTDAYYDTVTGGRIRIQTNVLDWQQIPQPTAGCFGDPRDQLWATADALADVPDDRFHTVVVYAPQQTDALGLSCPRYYAGIASIWDGTDHVQNISLPTAGSFDVRTTAHEFGHNLGLRHSGAIKCYTDATHQWLTSVSDTCDPIDYYGDPWDTMGQNLHTAQMSAYHLDELGLLDPADKRALATDTDVPSSTSVHVTPVESGAGLRLVTFEVDGTSYNLEYRTATGLDAWATSGATGSPGQGVLIRETFTEPDRVLDAALLNLGSPYPFSPYRPGLGAGGAWVSPDRSLIVRVTSADASGADVTFTQSGSPAPVVTAAADKYVTDEDTVLTVPSPGVLGNDAGSAGQPLTASILTGPGHGSVSMAADGSFAYTPRANYNGPDSFTYVASDGTSTAAATISLTVTSVNDAPITTARGYVTDEDTPVTVAAPGLLSTARDPDVGDRLTAVLASAPGHGTVTLNPDGSFVYTPMGDFNGTDSFLFQAFDGAAYSDPTPVSFTVNPVNDAPTAADDRYSTAEDTALTVPGPGVLGNDGDVDRDPLSAALVTSPSHGTLVLDPAGSFRYTPNPNYSGPDSFTYRSADGTTTSSPATVSLNVTSVNDAPTVTIRPGSCMADKSVEGAMVLTLTDVDSLPSLLSVSATTSNSALVSSASLAVSGAGSSRTLRIAGVAKATGSAVVTVKVNDGSLSGNANLKVLVGSSALLTGTAGVDAIFGTAPADVLLGLGGSDLICGGNGSDLIDGGDGDDVLSGGKGNDLLLGGDGADQLSGGAGSDLFSGGPGTDTYLDFTPAQGDIQG